jgi:hypothetical protein
MSRYVCLEAWYAIYITLASRQSFFNHHNEALPAYAAFPS